MYLLQIFRVSLLITMDENLIKILLAKVKNDLVAQMKETEKLIKESVKNDIKETERTIRSDIEVIKTDVAANLK